MLVLFGLWAVLAIVAIVLNVREAIKGGSRRPYIQLVLIAALTLFMGYVAYRDVHVEAGVGEVVIAAGGEIVEGPATVSTLRNDVLLTAREDVVSKRARVGKDFVSVTVQFRLGDKLDGAKLYLLAGERGSGYLRHYVRREVEAELESLDAAGTEVTDVDLYKRVGERFTELRAAGVQIVVRDAVVIKGGGERRHWFTDE